MSLVFSPDQNPVNKANGDLKNFKFKDFIFLQTVLYIKNCFNKALS